MFTKPVIRSTCTHFRFWCNLCFAINVQNRRFQMYKTDDSKCTWQTIPNVQNRRFQMIYFIVCFVHLESSILYIWNRLFCTFGIVCFIHLESSILYIWNRLFCTFGIVYFVHLESSVLYIWNRLFYTFGIVYKIDDSKCIK
jgi:hypothetical protein